PRGHAVAARPHAVVDRVTVDGEEGGAAWAGGVERGARAGRGVGAFLLAIDARLLVDRRVSRRCAAADQDRTQDQGRDDSHGNAPLDASRCPGTRWPCPPSVPPNRSECSQTGRRRAPRSAARTGRLSLPRVRNYPCPT